MPIPKKSMEAHLLNGTFRNRKNYYSSANQSLLFDLPQEKIEINERTPEQYETSVMNYCNDILNNRILSGSYTKKAIKRFLADLKLSKKDCFPYEFRSENADRVISFAESLIIPDIDTKLTLLPWMRFIYYNLFGWVEKGDSEKRRFRQSYVEVARKNSKTTSLLFPIILFDFFTTNAAESYFISRDTFQSEKCFRELKELIYGTPRINGLIEDTIYAITYQNSRIAFFSSQSVGIDSYKNSCSVFDEYHAYDKDKIVTAFRYGGRARKNNLSLIITSAGNDISKPCYAENQKAKKILSKIITDETCFSIIYAYDERDDWKNPDLLIKANPSISVIIDKNTLLNDLEDAKATPAHQPDFKAKTCGIWTSDSAAWLSVPEWENQPQLSADEKDFKGKTSYAALDLSSVDDFSAFTRCCKVPDSDFYAFFHRFYIPEQKIKEKYSKENIGIIEWTQNGIVTPTPGASVDYDFILRDIEECANEYNIAEIAYDQWQAKRMIEKADEKLPNVTFIAFDQSLKNLCVPTKDFEIKVLEHKIIDANPCMKWMVSNAVVKPDVNNNYKPLKEYKSSTKRIDGVITGIMALSRAIEHEEKNSAERGKISDVLKFFW